MRPDDQVDSARVTDSVQVVVDDAGVVRDVLIALTWRDAMNPGDLGPALCTAANWAIENQLVDRLDDVPEPEPTVMVRAHVPDAGGDSASPVAGKLVTEILDLLSWFDRDLLAYAGQLAQQEDHPAIGTGDDRGIVVAVAARTFTSVTVDPVWAATAGLSKLRAEALSAFEAAQREAADVNPVPVPASISRLRQLAGDPRALSRQLGLAR